ncbi:m7GpppX diphosphatase [Lingula anatina]|uniref:m7GpppX diphosphatase n=1 Tax=Lingula anatina TaxID=7574 RepID=A0A1S3K987_LINAN|nr:m7GpppX diphosphatase [Lingula anatina]|eukprot:XP_013418826.1 m7GpppX diphosphatase [Lingula anatina]
MASEQQRADAAVPIKKRKHSLEEVSNGETKSEDSFGGFNICKVLNENAKHKAIFVHGSFEGSTDDAVVILEKTPFTENTVKGILSSDTDLKLAIHNDIYKTFEAFPKPQENGIKATLIYPATSKHISKYTEQDVYVVRETAEDYRNITLPYIQAEQFSIQWVYNILDKKKEAERIVFEDVDPETGFILLPDMKWDCKQVNDLYLVAICHTRGLRSLRDLTRDHLPLLKNILEKGQNAIKEKYQVPPSKLRIYFHYQPSYYHLHVHFTHIKFDAPGSGVDRAHLIQDVIQNIEINGNFYQEASISFALRENDKLLSKFREAGKA